jgi:hypothetical protein
MKRFILPLVLSAATILPQEAGADCYVYQRVLRVSVE